MMMVKKIMKKIRHKTDEEVLLSLFFKRQRKVMSKICNLQFADFRKTFFEGLNIGCQPSHLILSENNVHIENK